ncbi:MAG TPA: hypothetical protein VEQ42_07040 [Pyrinomonadaceae bacterium]|nr:hypothetical protein [Pyrinomonadaceae bacterium]
MTVSQRRRRRRTRARPDAAAVLNRFRPFKAPIQKIVHTSKFMKTKDLSIFLNISRLLDDENPDRGARGRRRLRRV